MQSLPGMAGLVLGGIIAVSWRSSWRRGCCSCGGRCRWWSMSFRIVAVGLLLRSVDALDTVTIIFWDRILSTIRYVMPREHDGLLNRRMSQPQRVSKLMHRHIKQPSPVRSQRFVQQPSLLLVKVGISANSTTRIESMSQDLPRTIKPISISVELPRKQHLNIRLTAINLPERNVRILGPQIQRLVQNPTDLPGVQIRHRLVHQALFSPADFLSANSSSFFTAKKCTTILGNFSAPKLFNEFVGGPVQPSPEGT